MAGISAASATTSRTMTADLARYYEDKKTLWRNIILLSLTHIGWSKVYFMAAPLMVLHLNDMGLSSSGVGAIGALNSCLVSILVMYFSWRSDHTISRFGRRVPYLLISAPFIVATILLFPFITFLPSLIILYAVHLLFMDMKSSTFVLLPIDCVPRERLGRINSIWLIVGGIMSFISLRWGVGLSAVADWIPFVLAGGLMACLTAPVIFIREPPIANPTTESWKPWSSLAIGWKDRRMILLMLGVGLINSFMNMAHMWVWLFAKNELGLDRSDIGAALAWSPLLSVLLAWPVGWVVDRFGGLRVVAALWILEIAAFIVSMNITSAHGLIILSMMVAAMTPLYIGADMMVFKTAPPKDVGSVTSSNSFTRNLCAGILYLASGLIIERCDGDYRMAFIIGITMSSLGMLFFITHHLSVRKRAVSPAIPPPVELAAG